MKRFIRLFLFVAIAAMFGYNLEVAQAQPQAYVSGRIAPGDVRIFSKDSTYIFNNQYIVAGTLIIEPGTRILFNPQGKLVDSVGGRIIADGSASATYKSNPTVGGVTTNPMATPFSSTNPLGWTGYADLNYALYGNGLAGLDNTIKVTSTRDLTVNPVKYNHIFNVLVNKTTRKVTNLLDPAYVPAANEEIIPYETAMMLYHSRMGVDPNSDLNLNTRTWNRLGAKSVEITTGQIKFIGSPIGNSSREWGHIVILPGARAAFFRNVRFEGMKKDTTVDDKQVYSLLPRYTGDVTDWVAVNNRIKNLSNGSGGAITTFSSRTWLLDCEFVNNQARHKGGAVQFLQRPNGIIAQNALPAGSFYAINKNPNIINADGTPSTINNAVPFIDAIDENIVEPLTDGDRQAYDDARTAILLGRVRNLTFDKNKLVLAKYGAVLVGNPPRTITTELLDVPADFPQSYGNFTYGGAVYLAGETGLSANKIEVGLGVNNSINIGGNIVNFPAADKFVATGNTANNYQANQATLGARGGAIYVGYNTSLIISGKLISNETKVPEIVKVDSEIVGTYSWGGAIYTENTTGRLQVYGGPARDAINNSTEFTGNKSGRGGAIAVDGNTDATTSPVIGGSDVTVNTRDLGFNIIFENNTATAHGGAIYSERRTTINGAGGVTAGGLIGYGGKYGVRILNNSAGYSGGGLDVNIPNGSSITVAQRASVLVRAKFEGNQVGTNITGTTRRLVRGGGAVYAINSDLNIVKGVEFTNNSTHNGNGGAVSLVSPDLNIRRYFVTDLDEVVDNNGDGVYDDYNSENNTFTFNNPLFSPDTRMMTRFIGNKATYDADYIASVSSTGTTQFQIGVVNDVKKRHEQVNLPENGIGLGGGLYILDVQSKDRANRADSVNFNRVRMQNNESYTGAALYSDNYDLKLIFNRSLITGNKAMSDIGIAQNHITGAVVKDNNNVISENQASHDLASAVIYGEVQGPLPSYLYSEAANSIYNNDGRFLIRLPDAPITKGVLAGQLGLGFGGTDTLRGNYWGRTEANVNMFVTNDQGFSPVTMETFFIDSDGENHLPYRVTTDPADLRTQGPFESIYRYSYTPINLDNGADENTAAAGTIPDRVLMSGRIYDLYDKTTDIKTADYSARRMAPIEDFAVGIPQSIRRFNTATNPSNGKYVKRTIRDPYCLEATDDQGNALYPFFTQLQDEWRADKQGAFYHPIGYPLYLETVVDYDGIAENSNHDPLLLNETVFFVINETTGDFIRANFGQVSEDAPLRENFRARVELVPDSTNRNPNSTFRRTTEGLANFGIGFPLLSELNKNPYNEDLGTLMGRKYTNNFDALGNAPNIYSNRPAVSTPETYFAGERYRALPVNVGDNIRVVSRSVLWKEGAINAYNDGISFRITRSTVPAEFTGNAVKLATDTLTRIVPSQYPNRQAAGLMDTLKITEFLNKVFITEDREYPQAPGTYSGISLPIYGQGRDSIFAITARDTNQFYDPRSLVAGDKYTGLQYEWAVDNNSGLKNWLMADTTYANETLNNPKDEAKGFVHFKGRPTNPYIVPGGENVYVSVQNFPPHARLVDIIKSSGLYTEDQLSKLVEKFPSYFHAPKYETDNTKDIARYLQQDSIDFGTNFKSTYDFKLLVVDSIPVIFPDDYAGEVILRRETDGSVVDTLANYQPSILTCAKTEDGKLIANLTDKLRFQVDINSDDEAEDEAARTQHNWDFRYGQSSYSFKNLMSSGGTDANRIDIISDTTFVLDEFGAIDTLITQSRPGWLNNKYLVKYGEDTLTDGFGQDYITKGQLNIRIARDEAISLLTPKIDINNQELNTDTTFTIIMHDGHGGKTTETYDVFINIAPVITTNTLPNAVEGRDYQQGPANFDDTDPNSQMLDSAKRITAFDRNFGQKLRYELIYASDSRTEIPKDPCYPEAGSWDLTGLKTTPNWLKINQESGLLYGKPGIKDAPKTDKVTVLVYDLNGSVVGLSDLKQFDMIVEPADHKPRLAGIPSAECFEIGKSYSDTLIVTDLDLLRDASTGFTEKLTLSVVLPTSGFEVSPSTIDGPLGNDTVKVVLRSLPGANPTLGPDNRVTIIVRATDSKGNTFDIPVKIKVSNETNFSANVKVSNSIGAFQNLIFGVGANATTGDGTDGRENGTLDPNYCEFELANYPPIDAFDSRWTIPTINGTARSIYPAQISQDQIWIGKIQPGGETGGTSNYYPIKISWNLSEVPAPSNTTANPTGSVFYLRDATSNGSLFNINMNTGETRLTQGFIYDENGGVATLTINQASIDAFIIYRDWNNSVTETSLEVLTEVTDVTPNPVVSEAIINFNLNKANNVQIQIVDVLGNVISELTNDYFNAGSHSIDWNGRNITGQEISSGTYLVRMIAGDFITTKNINVVK